MEKVLPPRGGEPRQQRGAAAPIVSERQEIDDDTDPPATEGSKKTEAITSLATVKTAEEEVEKQVRAMVIASVVTSTSVAAAIICNETQLFPFLAKNIDDDSSITVAVILGIVLPVGAALAARGYLLKRGRQIAASELLDGDATMRVPAGMESLRRSGEADGGLNISADKRHTQRAREGRQAQRVGQWENSAEADIKYAELQRKIRSVRIATEAHERREEEIGKLTLEAMDVNGITTRNLRRVEQRVTAALDTLRSLGVVAEGTANDQLSQANVRVLGVSIGTAEAKRDASAKATAGADLEHGMTYQDMVAAAQALAEAELEELERVTRECAEATAAASKQRQKALKNRSLKAQQVREEYAKRDAGMRENRQKRHTHTTLRFNAEQKAIAALKATAAFKAQVERACARLEGEKAAASSDRAAFEACVRAACGSKTTQVVLDRRRTDCEKLMTDKQALDKRARTAQNGKCELGLRRAQKESDVKAAHAAKAAAARDYGRAVAMKAENDEQRNVATRRQMIVEERIYREEGKQAPANAANSPSLGSSDRQSSTEGGTRQEDQGACPSRKLGCNAGEHTDSILVGSAPESRQHPVSSEILPVAELIHSSAGASALPSTPARHDASTSAGLLAAGERFQPGTVRPGAGPNASPPAAAVATNSSPLPSVIRVAPMAAIAPPPTTEVSALHDLVASEGGRVANARATGGSHQNDVVREDCRRGGDGRSDASPCASRSMFRSALVVAPAPPPVVVVTSADQIRLHLDPGVVPPQCAGGGSVARGLTSPFCGLADTPTSPPSDRQHIPGLHVGPPPGFAFGAIQSALVKKIPSESIRREPNSWVRPVQGAPFQSVQVSSAFARPYRGVSIRSPPGFPGLHQASRPQAAERILAHADIQQQDPALTAQSPRNLSACPDREPFVITPPRQPPTCFPTPDVSVGIAHESPMYQHSLQAPEHHQPPQQPQLWEVASEVVAATGGGRDHGIVTSNGGNARASSVYDEDGNGDASRTKVYRPLSTASILPSPTASVVPYSAEGVPPGRASTGTLDANAHDAEGRGCDFGRAGAVRVASSIDEVSKVPLPHPGKIPIDDGRSEGSVASGDERKRRHVSRASVEVVKGDAVRVFAARAMVDQEVMDASSADIEGVDAAAGTAQYKVRRAKERKETVKKRNRQLEAFLKKTDCLRLLAKFSKDEMDLESIGFMRDSDAKKSGVTKAEMNRMRVEISVGESKLVIGNRVTAGTGGGQNDMAAGSESDNQEENGEPRCTICWDAEPQIQFLPCGHLVVCEGCVRIIKKKLCPTCRQKIEGMVKVFRS